MIRQAHRAIRLNCVQTLRVAAVTLLVSVTFATLAFATPYQITPIHTVTFGAPNPNGDQVLSPAINNGGDVLWAGQTQGGARVYLNSPGQNLAAQVPNANTIVDSRLPRLGANSRNAVWNASTGDIDPVTKQASPGSGYQEDRIYLYKPSQSPAPLLIGNTRFGTAFDTVTSPDVNDSAQAVFRQLNFPTATFSLFFHNGSGDLSGTSQALSNYNSINTTFINNSGVVAFYGRQTGADPLRLHLYDGNSGTLLVLPTALGSPSLRDFSDDGVALVFDGGNANGTMYEIDGAGVATPLFTAGTAGLNRVELGQRNANGQVVFGHRTVLATGGATPSAGQSNLALYDGGSIQFLTQLPLGTAVTAANINDRGEIVYATNRFLYDSAGNYTGLREINLLRASPVPETSSALSLGLGVVLLAAAALGRSCYGAE